LWGLYRYEKNKQKSVQELAFLLRMVNGPGTSYVEFLEGFLGIGKIEGNPKIKLLFLELTHNSGELKD
jgi:hypothetical protein